MTTIVSGNYSRNTIYRSETVIVKASYWKGSLQRYEYYFYKIGDPYPIKKVFVYLDGKLIVE
nr:MAG TPA: hypothetical protein [Bacteriophage sp.]